MPELGIYDPNAAPSEVFDPIPAGKYIAQIIASDVKAPKSGSGRMLALVLEICDGEYGGRKVFKNINLENANPKAQEIGQRELAALRLATGANSPKASEEFHGIPIEISVKVRPAGPDGKGVHREAQNDVKAFAKLGGDAPAQQQPSQQQATATAAPAKQAPATPPWLQGKK